MAKRWSISENNLLSRNKHSSISYSEPVFPTYCLYDKLYVLHINTKFLFCYFSIQCRRFADKWFKRFQCWYLVPIQGLGETHFGSKFGPQAQKHLILIRINRIETKTTVLPFRTFRRATPDLVLCSCAGGFRRKAVECPGTGQIRHRQNHRLQSFDVVPTKPTKQLWEKKNFRKNT